jgi:hypothetical protein
LAGPKTVYDKTISVKEDQYWRVEFPLHVRSKVSITVTHVTGPRFEVYVMDKKGYAEFDEAAGRLFGGQFHHFPELAGVVGPENTTYSKSGGLEAGEYVLMIDNSDFGDVSPPANFNDDVAEARVKIVVQ